MHDLWRLSAAELVQGYGQRAFTPVDAIEACLARVQEVQPQLNAFVIVDAASARAAAQASAQRWAAGQTLGPLDGVPVSLKDNLHAAQWPTTWGSRLMQGFAASHDEMPVARLRTAGMVLFGKTNLPEFAMQGTTSNLVTGTTRNPWNTALTPGGSSGGAVAAVASGCGPLALTTDGGGSTRRPAAHTGLVGFKPSSGCVPRGGGLPEIFLDYEVAGGIARTVQDVQQLVQVLAGVDLSTSAAPSPSPTPSRILYLPRFAAHPVDPGIAAQTRLAAQQLAALGHQVEEADDFDLAEPVNAMWSLLSGAGLAWMLDKHGAHPEFSSPPDTSLCTPASQAILQSGRMARGTELFALLDAVQLLKRQLRELFSRHDFLLTPATAALPWPAQETHPAQIDGQPVGPRGHAVFTAFANAAGLPAISLPCGMVQGLPTGLQLVGRAGADAQVLALAQQFEQAHPWQHLWPSI